VKSSRATQGENSPDTASVQQPVSDRSAIPGNKDEGTPTEDKMKRDPSEPAEEKRKSGTYILGSWVPSPWGSLGYETYLGSNGWFRLLTSVS